jgi:hypothetical protein
MLKGGVKFSYSLFSNPTYKIVTANKWETTTVVRFGIKLNYFVICEMFWILIVSYDKCLKKIKIPTSPIKLELQIRARLLPY